jgi:hypothetical protein
MKETWWDDRYRTEYKIPDQTGLHDQAFFNKWPNSQGRNVFEVVSGSYLVADQSVSTKDLTAWGYPCPKYGCTTPVVVGAPSFRARWVGGPAAGQGSGV